MNLHSLPKMVARHRVRWPRAVASLQIVLIALLSAPSSQAGNIFDDDWTPPKVVKPIEPLPGLAPPEPVKPPKPEAPTATPDAPATSPDAPAAPGTPDAPAPPAVPAPPASPPDAPARLPVPSPADQAESRKLFKEIFGKELADRSVTARKALATKLLTQAAATKDAPNDQFVLLVGAAQASTEASDLALCARAADAMADTYDVDGLHVKSEAAIKMKLRASTPAATAANCDQGLKLVAELVAADDLASAARLLQTLRAASPNAAMTAQLQMRSREVETMRAANEAVAHSAQKLRESPDDPAANLAVGQYLCYTKNDWKQGLPLIIKGGESDLSHAAKLDLAGPDDPKKQADLGDLWWNLSEKMTGPTKASVRLHAASWYDLALPQLGVLRRAVIQKRVDEAHPALRFDFQTASQLKSWIIPADWAVVPDGLECRRGETVIEFKPTGHVASATMTFTGHGCGALWFLVGEARYRIHYLDHYFGVLPPDFDRSPQPEKWTTAQFDTNGELTHTAKFWMAKDDRPAMKMDGIELVADKFRADSSGSVRVVANAGLIIHSITLSMK